MHHPFLPGSLALLVALLALAASAPCADTADREGENMLGRQAHNVGLNAVPAPGPVAIDGTIGDGEWDLSGRMWSFIDVDIRDRYSVKTAAMWDRENLYLAFDWADPDPLNGIVNPDFNPSKGWCADAVQIRVVAGDQTSWVTTWLYAPEDRACFDIYYWPKTPKGKRRHSGGDSVRLFGDPGAVELGQGVAMAYRKKEDESGFIQELRIPWSVLYREEHTATAGETIRAGFEFLWADPGGKISPVHRYADNLQPEHTSREFFWTARKAWGDLALRDKGGLAPRTYIPEGSLLKGTVPVRAVLPAGAKRFAMNILNDEGACVRHLAGDFLVESYEQKTDGEQPMVEVLWDCLDDAGKLVPAGAYRVEGLTHKGLSASYQQSFYNPGTPPWETPDGSGAWLSDHNSPERVARAGDKVILACGFAEGGSGTIGVDMATGRKAWSEKRGALALAADETYLYLIPSAWHIEGGALVRMTVDDGAYAPFERDGEALPFEYPLAELLGEDPPAFTGLAVCGDRLLLGLEDGSVVEIDKATAARVKRHAVGADILPAKGEPGHGPGGDRMLLAGARDGGRFFCMKDGKLTQYTLADGSARAIPTPGLGEPTALALDNRGNLLVADMGPHQQIKAYSLKGALVYTCAQKGGRPPRGPWRPQTLTHVSDIAVDARGYVWATEHYEYPRRVSVWNWTGALVRDYIGNTRYAAGNALLHDDEPNVAFVGPVRMRLHPTTRTYTVEEITWVPEAVDGPSPSWAGGKGHVFYSQASGRLREYALVVTGRSWLGLYLFMNGPDGWRPVSALTSVGGITGAWGHRPPSEEERNHVIQEGPFKGFNHLDWLLWNDGDADGVVEPDECEVYKADLEKKNWYDQMTAPLGWGWSNRADPDDLTLYTGRNKGKKNGIAYAIRPARFAPSGAPIYTKATVERFAGGQPGIGEQFVPVPGGDAVLRFSMWARGVWAYSKKSGKLLWHYPNRYAGVHGSHHAPMPRAGMLIGPIKLMGVADGCGEAGSVFCLRGNLGQDYFLTTDGLFVGAMHPDCRLPSPKLPDSEARMAGFPMESVTVGGEPFGGWFGRQNDGMVRKFVPRSAAPLVVQVHGLGTTRRFAKKEPVTLDEKVLAKAAEENAAREMAKAGERTHTIARVQSAPDGKVWREIKPLPIERRGQPVKGRARLAYDKEFLYARFEVNDPNPWKNAGKDFTRLFKTGDAVDIQLSPTANAERQPAAGDLRVVLAPFAKESVAVLMRPKAADAPDEDKVVYHSPVFDKHFDQVALVDVAQVEAQRHGNRYTVTARVPWAALGITPEAGKTLRGDAGFILSDEAGTINTARVYWANKMTNLVNDLPSEAWLYPNRWGTFVLE